MPRTENGIESIKNRKWNIKGNTEKGKRMIEKLPINRFSSQIELKINELVDFANAILRDCASGYSSFKNVDFENSPQPINKYEEQIKWIGCLVEFNIDSNDSGNAYGILTGIRTDGSQYPFIINNGEYYAWSVRLPDDSLIYKNEK